MKFPFIFVSILTLLILPLLYAQDTPPPLSSQSSVNDVLAAAAAMAKARVNDRFPLTPTDASPFIQQCQAVTPSTLIAALTAAPTIVPGPDAPKYRDERDFLADAVRKLATTNEIPDLLNGNCDCLNVIQRNKWSADPRVTHFLMTTLSGWKEALPTDGNWIGAVLRTTNDNDDPKVTAVLDQVISTAVNGTGINNDNLYKLLISIGTGSRLCSHAAPLLLYFMNQGDLTSTGYATAQLTSLALGHPAAFANSDFRTQAINFLKAQVDKASDLKQKDRLTKSIDILTAMPDHPATTVPSASSTIQAPSEENPAAPVVPGSVQLVPAVNNTNAAPSTTSSVTGPQPCVIITPAPLEACGADGGVTGVTPAVVGAHYQFLGIENDKAVLRDSKNQIFRISPAAIDRNPSPADVSTAASENKSAPAGNPQFLPAAIPSAKEAPNQSGAINRVVGVPLFASSDFWTNDADKIADQLSLRRESATSGERSYRSYAHTRLFGAGAYSVVLYARLDPSANHFHPTYLSIIFANAGDLAPNPAIVEAATKSDETAIQTVLTSLLGNPTLAPFGNAADNRQEMRRWDSGATAFLLSAYNKSYTSLKIIPSAVADRGGIIDVTPRDELRAVLAGRVVQASNGDVTIKDIPMVDQGPHLYCVPATWERYLRYVGVPADLYELAQLGQSSATQGTTLENMTQGIDSYVSAYHRRIETEQSELQIGDIKRSIDKGIPLMWGCYLQPTVEALTSQHTQDRSHATDLGAYGKHLRDDNDKLGTGFVAKQVDANGRRTNGHLRMIIGYNETTKEIATSDSWGNQNSINWIYLPTAIRISQGVTQYITW